MLNIDPIVKINVNVGSTTASAGVFDVGAILGSTAVAGYFDASNRFKEYESLADMVTDGFLTSSDEYKAAAKYFGVNPAPQKVVMIYYMEDPVGAPYDATATYEVGDYCTHENKLYQCNTAISTAEQWNASHWTEVETTGETPTSAMLDAIDKGAEFYSAYYIPMSQDTDAVKIQNVASLASAMDGLGRGVVFYGYVGSVDSAIGNGSAFTSLKDAGAKRAIGLFCTSEVDDAAGMMGAAMGLSRQNSDSAFALCYKTIASATVNNLTQTDVIRIKGVNGNVYVQRTKERAFVENGATATGLRFDEILYVDRMCFEIQNGIYELIADSATKLPQEDSTSAIFLNEIYTVLEGYYAMGVLSDAPWRGEPVFEVETGDIIEHGHAEMVESFDNQTEADRLLHKAMPITVLLCLSGSVESIVITVDVQT